MRNFKIKVTPKESEVVQKLLFLAGYKWFSGGPTEIKSTNSPYLFFDNSDVPYMTQNLTYSNNKYTFINDNNPEITFEEFITEIELNEKFQNKS
jgi:hypothetical protein